jgi:tetratricopeptide (TPR) repeat protein
MRAQLAGDNDLAGQLAENALQIGIEAGQPDAAIVYGAQALGVSIQRGTIGELIPLIEQAASDVPDLAEVYAGVLALAHAHSDRTDEAAQLLERFSSRGFDLSMDVVWITGMLAYGEAAIHCRNPRFAGPIYDLLVPWSNQWASTGGTTAEGPVSRCLGGLAGVLGRYDEAETYFSHSVASSERFGVKFVSASTNLWWGDMLARRSSEGNSEGDRAKARDLLNKAQAAAAEHGYGLIERRAIASIQQLESR